MYTINKTNEFSDWLSALRDIRAKTIRKQLDEE